MGTSLVVQWLRLCAANGEGTGSIPGQWTRSHMLQLRPSAAKKKKKSLKCAVSGLCYNNDNGNITTNNNK